MVYWHGTCNFEHALVEVKMSIADGMNIIDKALNLALNDLEHHGMQTDDAQIALLVRLASVVPEDVFNVASMLRNDADLLTSMNHRQEEPASSISAE